MFKHHAIIQLCASVACGALGASCAIEASDDVVRGQQAITGEPALLNSDPPTPVYTFLRPLETSTYPRLATLFLTIHDSTTIAYLDGAIVVRYQLTYQPLSNASGVASVSPIEVAVLGPIGPIDPIEPPVIGPRPPPPPPPPPPPLPTTRVIRIDPNGPSRGLVAHSAYRLKIQLFDAANLPLGPQSDWIYAVTAGTSTNPSDTLKWGRVDMVLRAFDQLGDAQNGLIGAGGTLAPDGTRFVSVNHPNYDPGDETTGWCDWFYHYLGVVVTDGLDGSLAADPVADGGNLFWHDTMNPDNVPNAFRDPLDDGCGTALVDIDATHHAGDVLMAGCQDHDSSEVDLDTNDNRFYSNKPGNIYYDATKSLPQNQGMGNYQAMDWHAGMFLAFDPNGDGTFSGSGAAGTLPVGTVWSIEGNVSDTVKVMHRAGDSTTINGFGKLTATMFAP
jgi:hypothetical protein